MAKLARRNPIPAALALLLTLGSPSLASGPAAGEPGPAVQSLVLAERAFVRSSVERGMREAFLAFLDDDAVIFRPGPVAGRDWFEARPPVPGRLSWEPLYADVSRAGDLGFTTGPWQFTPPDGEPSFGHYVTVWRRRGDGAWRVAADIGVTHRRPEVLAGDLTYPEPRRAQANQASGSSPESASLEALQAADLAFAALAADQGTEQACLRYGAEALRVYRNGALPLLDRAASCRALAQWGERAGSRPAGQAIADSRDLGYVYGTLEFAPVGEDRPGGPGSFLRIWKLDADGAWRLVLDASVAHPPESAQP